MITDTVLLVEDEPVLCRVLAAALRAGGYEVVTASSAAEAMAAALDTEPAVAVLSMELREGDAGTLVRAFSSSSPETEIILLAEPASLDKLVGLYDLRTIYNHRWKPLDEIGDLARDVARAMERRALKRQNSYLLTELRDTRDELRSQAEFMAQVERLAASGQVLAAGSRAAHAIVDSTLKDFRDVLSALSALGRGGDDGWVPLDLNLILGDALRLIAAPAAEADVRIHWSPCAGGASVYGCRSRLIEAALHLLLNAVDAMPDGGDLTVTCDSEPDGRAGAQFTVRDSGTGIDPTILPRVFDPFFTTGPFGKRTGLGLWATRAIIRQHDGEISLDTAVGRGTIVAVRLRAARSAAIDGRVLDSSGSTLRAA